ncbi:MAG: HEAT repeat domain-containing protein [Candidatus Eiseniibacteriota bacterium]
MAERVDRAPWPPREGRSREAWVEIAMLEDTRATDTSRLLGFLQSDADPLVRWRVCRAFARLQDSTGTNLLLTALATDTDVRVRREAAFAIGQIGSRSATVALGFAAREQPDLEVRARALEALGKLGDKRGTAAVVAGLGSPEPLLSREAAIACWRLADSSTVWKLADATKSKDSWTRAFAAYALEKTPYPEVSVKELDRLLSDPEVAVRAYAARSLGRQRSPTALGPLVRAARDRDWRVRVATQRSFGTLADSAALPQVLAGISDPEPYVRESAIQSTALLRSRDAVPALRGALKDREPAVRLAAARALATVAGADAWPSVRDLLADPERWVRAGTLEALGDVPGEEPLLILKKVAAGLRVIGGPASFEERSAAFNGLATRRDKTARAEILSGMTDSNWITATAAAGAAGESGDSTLVPDLVRLLRNNREPREPDVELAVLAAFTAYGPGASKVRGAEELSAVLDSSLASPDVRIRDAAANAYRAVYGDSALARARTAHAPPAWKAAAFGPYRDALAEEDSTGAIGRVTGARLQTARGVIELSLDPREAPNTVRNFVTLADSGYYNGTRWHRVVPYFVIQDGDPLGTGNGGPGYAFRCEYNRLRYDTGALGMALAGKDTGGSQYFITQSPQPHLDGRYTIFGHVVKGQDVVDTIRRGDRIEKVEILRR